LLLAWQWGRFVQTNKRRMAIVGTGHRGAGTWGEDVPEVCGDHVQLAGLSDANPARLAVVAGRLGLSGDAVSTDLNAMLAASRPHTLLVATRDDTHADIIVHALEQGIDVITEKPMATTAEDCRRILDAEARTGRRVDVAFNYRFAPTSRKLRELVASGRIGTVTSVDFHWYLDTTHGADYFRRWHAYKRHSGSLFVHKATHHFDLMNWWLDADPVEVTASGDLEKYGARGPFRHTYCRPCPHKGRCPFYWDMTGDPRLMALYAECESVDGYHRDGCVFREDVNIFDTMAALVRYSNGVSMAYSLNAFMPFEGYRVGFNGEKGRLEVRDYERQPFEVPRETEMQLTLSFGKREEIEVPRPEGGHAGGDDILRDVVFRKPEVPEHLRLPGARAGALSCLTGIAARKSVASGSPVRIGDLVTFPGGGSGKKSS
jgi:predicted dehydrogenase